MHNTQINMQNMQNRRIKINMQSMAQYAIPTLLMDFRVRIIAARTARTIGLLVG